MSKYFAKYLPVEGEIREGDTTLLYGEFQTFACDFRATVPLEDLKSLRKYKLFLCSRDIQVGDEIFSPMGNAPHKKWKVIDSVLNMNTTGQIAVDLLTDDMYKVIGEISPDATFVKEGDEFDGTQLGFLMDGFIQKPWSELNTAAGFKMCQKGTWKIAVKGPCGHFH